MSCEIGPQNSQVIDLEFSSSQDLASGKFAKSDLLRFPTPYPLLSEPISPSSLE